MSGSFLRHQTSSSASQLWTAGMCRERERENKSLLATVSNLIAMASNLLAMASTLMQRERQRE